MSGEISSDGSDLPNGEFDRSDDELLQNLRKVWGIAPDAPLTVVGLLRGRALGDARAVFFLEGLENPSSGIGLVYPTDEATRPANAFVSKREVSRVANAEVIVANGQWAIAELELSSLDERRKHNNAYKCDVRRSTLKLLSEIPRSWNVLVTGTESVHRMSATAHQVIHERVGAEQALLERQIAQSEALVADKKRDLQEVSDRILVEQNRLEQLSEHFSREMQLMDDRIRRLSELLTEKGRRLIALDLIDEDDFSALLPQTEAPDLRIGHDFQDALDGDFARLAPFVQARLWKKGMLFSKAQLRDFLALVRTHDLVVLAGDSGAGKTSLVRAVAESIGGRCTIIPVKPNWTGPEDLLGYYNPIERRYQPTPFLLALLAAESEPDVPHFICLDEMNIARVEHYFADFLSLLESRDIIPTIPLYTSDEERHTVVENGLFLMLEAEARARASLPDDATLGDLLKDDEANRMLHQLGGFQGAESVLLHHGRLRRGLAALMRIPTGLRFPSNVRIFGSVNIDETTHYLSPKVLDRVHILRFRNPILMDWEALEAEVEAFELDLALPVRLTPQDLGSREDYPPFDRTDEDAAFLAGLARRQLDPLGIEFGLRAIRQALGYIRQAATAGINRQAALNNVVLHKILPKLMLDTGRPGANGRNKRDILVALRDELADHLVGLDQDAVTETCVDALDRLIAAAEGNNGIANYWLR